MKPRVVSGVTNAQMLSSKRGVFARDSIMALGLLTWTIVEYGVHRFVLHSVEAVARLHEQHHATPGAYVGTPT
jgi:hypothetical protein